MTAAASNETSGARQSFALAPMTTGLRLLTIVVHLIPAEMFWRGLSTPGPGGPVQMIAAGLVVAISIATLLWMRPRRFEVDAASLRIVWPLRAREIPRSHVLAVELLGGEEFRSRHRGGVRIGVGGLWGSFGLLQADGETFSMWSSRRDVLVSVRLGGGARPLLLTPASPERFVATLSAP